MDKPSREDIRKLVNSYVAGRKTVDKAEETKALMHLKELVLLAEEWQIDWAAMLPIIPKTGAKNPDFDPEYLKTVQTDPSKVFHPKLLRARAFLEEKGILNPPLQVSGK